MNEQSFAGLSGFHYHNPSPAPAPCLFTISRAGCSRCEKDFLITRDITYSYYTIHILLDGCGFFHIAGQDFLLKKGDAFLITPNEEHLYRTSPDSSLHLLWIEFSGSFCKELFGCFQLNKIHVLKDNTAAKAAGQLAAILYGLKVNTISSEFECSSMLYQLIMYLAEATKQTCKHPLPEIIASAVNYIDNNFTNPINITQLADTLHISHTYLTKLFRQHIGTTPLKYITLKKIEFACFLLQNTAVSIEEISEQISMYDNAYFYKVFKSLKGMTPAQYRARK